MLYLKKLGVIVSFAAVLGILVLFADAMLDERTLPPTHAPIEDDGRDLEPVITITDIPVAAAFAAPE